MANVRPGNEYDVIYCNPAYGPSFGGGHDIHIAHNAIYNRNSYSQFNSYQVPPGTKTSNALLAGSYNFTPTEIEVFM